MNRYLPSFAPVTPNGGLLLCPTRAIASVISGKPEKPFGEDSWENQVMVVPAERDRSGRLVAEVFVSAGKVTEEWCGRGWRIHYAKYSDPSGIGFTALSQRQGLFGTGGAGSPT